MKGEKASEPGTGSSRFLYDTTSRSGEDVRYGFISAVEAAGGSQTLKLLSPGDRVRVKIPKTGYVGVGVVREAVQAVNDFKVETPEGERPCLDVLQHADQYQQRAHDPEKASISVKVDWPRHRSGQEAVNEVGLSAIKTRSANPAPPKWRHTVERLKTHFPNWNHHE
ncbi:MAG: hypothetical protein R3F31_14755 [Verrucomicrobiales bacterium]